jgi:hypothetical protein
MVCRIGVLTAGGCLRSGQGRQQQPGVPYGCRLAEHPARGVEHVVEVKIDHWPKRSRASANLGNSSSSTLSSRAPRLVRAMYSRIASLATSCIERSSRSAVLRSASLSAWSSRRVVAMATWCQAWYRV